METEDGRAHIWYADVNGNVTGYTETVDNIAGTIIEAYNEHFSTDIQLWTPETKTLQVGDTVPDWNAYEKIEMSHYDIAVAFATVYLFGHVDGHIYTYSAKENGGGFPANENGIIQEGELINPQSELYEGFIQKVKTKLSDYNVTTVTWESKSYQQGDQIENWGDYIKV